jgi:hypothetical protein
LHRKGERAVKVALDAFPPMHTSADLSPN